MGGNPVQVILNAAMAKLGTGLLRAAVVFQAEMRRRLNVSAGPKSVRRRRDTVAGRKGSRFTAYTDPSKPGEFLRKRTGHGQAGVLYEPATPGGVAAAGSVRVGYAQAVKYMAAWELKPAAQRRKGLMDLFREMEPQLRRVAGLE